MLRRLSVRGKILATLAVPVLVLVFAAVFVSAQSLREVQVTRAITGALDALQINRVYSEALQAEREAGVLHAGEIRLERRLPFLGEDELLTDEEEEERAARAAQRAENFDVVVGLTDSTMTRAHDRLRQINFDALDPVMRDGVERTIEASSRLTDVRASVRSGNLAPNLVDRQYSLVLTEIVQLVEQFATTIDNRSLGTYLAAHALVDQTVERMTNERGFGMYTLEGDGQENSAREYLVNLFPETSSTQARARQAVATLGDPNIEMPDWGAQSDAFTDFQNLRSRLQTSTLQDWAAVSEDTWVEQGDIEIEALEPTRTALWNAVQRNGATAQGAALSQATLTILLAVAALVLSVLLALLIARSIVVPLQRLTEAAGEVRDQLPRLVEQVATPGEGPDLSLMQIPVESADEIGTLAEAFNEVNQKTVEVAQEQAALRGSIAEMFVNVARRDQVLLNRQLSFIDTLEREEEDPNTLSNLFRLDHLATRMRRNAESLLVLAGIDSGRRVRGSMPLSDVVRTASSEIEQYDRINLQLGVDPQMHGFNSLPAAHLLAEIMENATVFSEPGTPVDVVTSAEIEFITVTVIDRGLGMTADDIKDANQRIRQSTASDVIGAQRLGLHVVGRLANRLGTKVVFARADDEGGTQVRVRFPRALFVDDASEAQPSSGGRVLSSAEIGDTAPEVAEVDLAALTDGETGLGLPRRRANEPAPAPAPAQAPAAAAPQAPAETSAGLPTRRNIVLPEVATPTLAPDVAADAAAGWTPAVAAPAPGGLPSRSRGASAGALPSDDGPVAPPRPAAAELAPEQRSGMFAGFRRGSEAVEAPQQGVSDEVATEGEDASSTAALPKRSEQQFAIPALAPDDDERAAEPAALAPEHEEPAASYAPTVEPEVWAPPVEAAAPEAPESDWAPAPDAPQWSEPSAWGEQPPAEQPPAEQPAAEWAGSTPSVDSPYAPSAPSAPAWGEPAAADAAPVWGQPAAAESAPAWGEPAPAEPAAAWDAASQTPAEQPTYEQPTYEQPTYEQPAYEQPTYEQPTYEQPAYEQPTYEQPTYEQPAYEQPTYEQSQAAASWGPADPAWSPAEVSHASPPSAYSPQLEPQEPAAPAAYESQYPAFSPDAGYAPQAPVTEPGEAWSAPAQPIPALSPDPAPPAPVVPPQPPAAATWSPTEPGQPIDWNASAPAAPVQPLAHAEPAPAQPAATPGWLSAASPQSAAPAPVPATAPAPVAPMAPLPSFSDLVGQDDAPSRRSRRGGAADTGKPSRAERRAAKRAEAKERAEEKALAKAEARTAKKGKGKSVATPPVASSPADAPSTGFFSQPTSIAALRAGSAPSAAAPAPLSAAWAPDAPSAPAAPVAPAASVAPAAPAPVRQSSWGASAPQAPAPAEAPAQQSFAPAPQREFSQPSAPTPAPPAPMAPAAASGSKSFTPAPAAWTPGGADGGGAGARQFGVLDDEVAAMLALRSDIQEQALSELSQLSAYRPQIVKPAASLTRRTPTAIPSAPEMEASEGDAAPRDAEQLRSRLSSFQSGTSRGRRAMPAPTNPASSTDGAAPQANGSAEHAAPEAPPSDSAQEAQTW